jgi:hypothetical protein
MIKPPGGTYRKRWTQLRIANKNVISGTVEWNGFY